MSPDAAAAAPPAATADATSAAAAEVADGTPDAEAADGEWATVLDTLERQLSATPASTPDAAPWTEPTTSGPVPRALVGRASRLLAAQRDRLVALETERRQTLEHLGALRQVAATDEPRSSVYLDTSA